MQRSVVVLPQPEGPSSVKNSPGFDLEVDAEHAAGRLVASVCVTLDEIPDVEHAPQSQLAHLP